ncbi:hypothetical protein BDQ12DRAFT_694649 [Crucibulum laeve]|uniref:Uncharacterized protein n=1 Tax=Crucibulum laeve TaxID=68775 RepID=A0A5C3LQG9_9AGAR|nr:hypothetical protein BDQ12DRAFT_694649 [Crucibulum laeve]
MLKLSIGLLLLISVSCLANPSANPPTAVCQFQTVRSAKGYTCCDSGPSPVCVKLPPGVIC